MCQLLKQTFWTCESFMIQAECTVSKWLFGYTSKGRGVLPIGECTLAGDWSVVLKFTGKLPAFPNMPVPILSPFLKLSTQHFLPKEEDAWPIKHMGVVIVPRFHFKNLITLLLGGFYLSISTKCDLISHLNQVLQLLVLLCFFTNS